MIEVLEAYLDMDKAELKKLSSVIVEGDYGITEKPQYVRDAEKAKIDVELDRLVGMDGAKALMDEYKTKIECKRTPL